VEHPATDGFALVVNTTSASLSGADLPIAWSPSNGGSAYEVMYASGSTPFLQSAASHGWHTIDGKALLVAQGARSFTWWLGREAPTAIMAEAIT
jgi:shikimate dehydrogenase